MKNNNTTVWEKKENRRFKAFNVFLVLFVMAGLLHLHHWNEYFFEVFPLKTAQVSGTASEAQLLRLAEICKERNKVGCQIKSYQMAIKLSPRNYVSYEKLAEIQYFAGFSEAANHTIDKYFIAGGDSVRANYINAKVKEAVGRFDEAESAYVKTLKMKPEVIQISVSEDYVNLLINRKKFAKAKKFIERLRKRGASENFLSSEYTVINTNLKQSS